MRKGWPCLFLAVGGILFLGACRPQGSGARPEGVIHANLRWDSPEFPVCFETLSRDGVLERRLESLLTKQYNERTVVKFTGFQKCQPGVERVVRVSWDNGKWPQTRPGRNHASVILNPDLSKSPVQSLREECSRSPSILSKCFDMVALHEFGHVVGLGHENMRPERPATTECSFFDEHTAEYVPTVVVNPYDAESIMNKCYYRPLTGTERTPTTLSAGDVRTINLAYGPEAELKKLTMSCSPGASGQGAGGGDAYVYSDKLGMCVLRWVGDGGCPEGTMPDDRAGYCKDLEFGMCIPAKNHPCPLQGGTPP